MKKIFSYFLFPGLILLVIAGVFYADKTLPMGADTAFYFDLSFLISKGGKFLVNLFDYRTPVFGLIFSPIFKLGLSDFGNRFLIFTIIYSFYCLSLYFISLFFTRSSLKSAVAALLVFVSISARQFDIDRNISIPLFYDTLELVSLFLLFRALVNFQNNPKKGIPLFALFSGVFYGLALIGRQTHISVPVILLGATVYFIYRAGKNGSGAANGLFVPSVFLIGLAASVTLLLKFFYVPGIDFFSLAKKWLIDAPVTIYRAEPLRIVIKFVTALYRGLPEMKNLYLPIIWLTYVITIASTSAFLFSGATNDMGAKVKDFYHHNRKEIVFIFLMGFMAVATVLTTAVGARNHEAPFFSLYFFILVFVLHRIKLRQYFRNWVAIILVAIFILPNLIDFTKKESGIYLANWRDRSAVSFPERVAGGLRALIKPGDTVLVLGAYPVVARLADYRPFMGLADDTFLYIGQKVFGDDYQQNLMKNLEKVNVAYKLLDYPNLVNISGIRENTSNAAYAYIESYLKSKFEKASVIKQVESEKSETRNSYGNYTDRVTVYRRIKR